MINEIKLRDLLEVRFPNWNLNISKSGVALWVNLNDGVSNYFELQVTPSEGIGVSIIENTESDMSGHDEDFDSLGDALEYIEGLLDKK